MNNSERDLHFYFLLLFLIFVLFFEIQDEGGQRAWEKVLFLFNIFR